MGGGLVGDSKADEIGTAVKICLGREIFSLLIFSRI